jgi:hypothetical protein
MIYKKRGGRVTQSQAHPLYSLDYCAAGKASEANWKPAKALLNDLLGANEHFRLFFNINSIV